MMVEKEDLGLSLSLSFPQNHHSLHLNLMPSLVPSSTAFPSGFNPKSSWNEAFPSSGASHI
jgi:homeobox-leucine zipper protein